jgi:hypothetical protein
MRVTVAERSAKRCQLFEDTLHRVLKAFGLREGSSRSVTIVQAISGPKPTEITGNIVNFGARAEDKPRLFVAMPFADDFLDEFQIGFCEAARASAFICERLDISPNAFTGDIVAEIKRRILGSEGVLALLNDHNPNVFLEIGFAFAHNKPTILVAKHGITLPFDVSGQRCIRYRNIVDLRDTLTREIASLRAQGVLAKRA